MLDAGIPADECFRILHQLEELGILVNDLGLTVRLSKGGGRSSSSALRDLDRLERELLDLMSERAPDADVDGGQQHLTIRPLCTELRRRLELPDSDARVSPQVLRTCLSSLAENFGSGTEKRSMLQIQGHGPDSLRVVLHRPWSQIRTICERRRATAQVVLARLLAELPAGATGVQPHRRVQGPGPAGRHRRRPGPQGDLARPGSGAGTCAAVHARQPRARTRQGRSVFRSAMTIQTDPAARQAALQEGRLRAAGGLLSRTHAADARDARVRPAGCRERRAGRPARERLLHVAPAALRAGVLQGPRRPAGPGDHRRVLPSHRRRSAAPGAAGAGRDAGARQPPGAGRSRLRQDARHRAPHRLPAAGAACCRRTHHRPGLQPQCGRRIATAPHRAGR